jgi:hypothetical protein
MDSIRTVSQRDACFPEDAGAAASQGTTPYTVKKGDTLAKLAAGLQQQGLKGSLEEILRRILTLNPQIKDPNRIARGATLELPVAPASTGPGPSERKTNHLEEFVCRFPMASVAPAPRPAGAEAAFTAGALACMGAPATQTSAFLRTNGTAFATSPDGTPKYKQADYEAGGNWGARLLGDAAEAPRTIASRGCAMTSVAMALSKLSGETITPAVLDAFLDARQGYDGNAIKWGTAGKVTASPIEVTKKTAWNLDTLNAELAAGRPVVLGVDYKTGNSGGSLGTDHWVCLTRRDPNEPNRYFANDPATGAEISFLRQPDGRLKEEQQVVGRAKYKSSGEFVTFRAPVK